MLSRARACDRAYDGRFLTGVLSTGIYCLPSCPARPPKEENIRFFDSEEGARAAGLRPCRRCKPDFFYRDEDPDLSLVVELAAQVREQPGAFQEVETLADYLKIGLTKLNLLFRRYYHTTPASFLQRVRLDAVCRELLADRRPVLDSALAVGWNSISAFHTNFRKATGLTPGEYRKLPDKHEFVLKLPLGYQASEPLRYLGCDSESLLVRVAGAAFAKGVWLDGRPSLLTVEVGKGVARCRIEGSVALSPAAATAAHAAALRLLGLQLDPAPFEWHVQRNPELVRLIVGREGLRLPQASDLFEGLIWAIISQQMNRTSATTLRRRIVELCGNPIPGAGGLLSPPLPEAVARLDAADLCTIQFSHRKAEYLIGAAQAIVAGKLPIDRLPEEPTSLVERRLLTVRGLGPWTPQFVMLRVCGFGDCVPAGDAELAAGLVHFFNLDHWPSPEEICERLEPFAPFRSFATAHLWASLGTHHEPQRRRRPSRSGWSKDGNRGSAHHRRSTPGGVAAIFGDIY